MTTLRHTYPRSLPAATGIVLLLAMVASAAVPGTQPPFGRSAFSAPPVPVGAAAAPAYRWPLPGPPPVTRELDLPDQPWLPGHRGVDLAGRAGAQVSAAGGGVVYFAGPVAGRPVVSILHPDGLRTTYQPVSPAVAAGDQLAAGEPVGTLEPGHRGCPVAACLHWGLRRGEVYLDPRTLLGAGQVRLLPRRQVP